MITAPSSQGARFDRRGADALLPNKALRFSGQNDARLKLKTAWAWSKSHAHAEDPRMIIHRGQRNQYGVIGYDRDLIGDAEVKLHTVVDLKTAKHNARAHKELVSA